MNEALKRIKKNIHNYVIGAFLVLVLLYLLLNIATNDNSFFSIELLIIILLLLSLIEEASLKEEPPDNKTKTTSEKITEEVSATDTKSDKFIEEISNMNKIITHLQGAVEKNEEEIKRYKKGYDADIFHTFLFRFTKVDKVLKEYINDGKIDLEGLDDIQIQMEDALKECKVEVYSPEIGANYKTLDYIADNPKKIPTSDKNLHETIAEIYQVGYLRRLPDSSLKSISEARVVVYEYDDNNLKE
jgi:hypothetical protein